MTELSKRQNVICFRLVFCKINEIIKKSTMIKDGIPTQYHLNPKTEFPGESESYKMINFGEREKNKPHKTILMVGETGTGKTTLINAIVNYILDVQRKDKVWFEITDDQSDQTSPHTQTTKITVYGVYLQESPVDLTIIDTPGYGDTRGVDLDKEIAESFFSLSNSKEMICELDAVCLVIKATQNRLSERQLYIFDAIQSIFGKDIAENIVLLLTHSDGMPPKNALTAVKEAGIKCAVNEQKNQPEYFLFNNCQSEAYDEEFDIILEQSWNRSFKGMEDFFKFADTIKPKSLKMTRDVLQQRQQLEANVSNIRLRVQTIEQKQNELKQTQAALEINKEHVKEKANFNYVVDVPYKERVDIDPSLASKATCCIVCKENCHYPGCWWVRDLSWCSVMKHNYCTVCTNKCHYSKHIKEPKIYVTKTKKVKRTYEDLKKKYDGMIGDGVSLVKKLENKLHEVNEEKIKLVMEAFSCVETLEKIALKTDSLLTLQHIDFLIEKLKEIKEPEKAQKLENTKKAQEGKQAALIYMKSFLGTFKKLQ